MEHPQNPRLSSSTTEDIINLLSKEKTLLPTLLDQLWKTIDKDSSGDLSKDEAKEVLSIIFKNLKDKGRYLGGDDQNAVINKWMESLDSDGKGVITKVDFEEELMDLVEGRLSTKGSSQDFLVHVYAFVVHRKEINELWKSLTSNSVEQLPNVDKLRTKENGVEKFNPDLRQRNLNGSVVTSIEELYKAAEEAKKAFDEVLREIAKSLDLPVYDTVSEADKFIQLVPLKGKIRAAEKANNDYSERIPGPSYSWLFDLVRASIVLNEEKDIVKIIEFMKAHPKLEIIQLKNRFKYPTTSGFRDLNMNVLFKFGTTQHACEIQIHHVEFKRFEKVKHSHEHYEFFRSYFSGNMAAVNERLNALDTVHSSIQTNSKGVPCLREMVKSTLKSTDIKKVGDIACLLDFLNEYEYLNNILKHKVELERQIHGNENADLASSIYELGTINWKQGVFQEALENYEESYNIRAKVLGMDHPDVAESLSSIGLVLSDLGKEKEALDKYNESYNIFLKKYGPEHEKIADYFNLVANLLTNQGKYKDALEKYQEVYNIHLKLYGTDHEGIALSLNNMANVLRNLDKLSEAVDKYEEALKIRRKLYGEYHYKIADTINNLAVVYADLGKAYEALEKYEESLNIRIKILGNEHPDVADSLNNIAATFYQQNRYPAALEKFEESLNIRIKIFGHDHPKVADSLNNIGNVLSDQKKYQPAHKKYEEGLKILQKIYGNDHPEVADCLHNLGIVLRDGLKQPQKALEKFEESHRIRKKVFGDEEYVTTTSVFQIEETKNLISKQTKKSQSKKEKNNPNKTVK